MNTTAPVIALDTPAALDAARVGRKAANLAAARAAGLPVAPGVVLTADWSSEDTATAVQVWRIISHDGARSLVVRPVGRRPRPSPPGAATGAIEAAPSSPTPTPCCRRSPSSGRTTRATPVLVQPHVPGAWRGVLFADDAAGLAGSPAGRRRRSGVHRLPVDRRARPRRSGARRPVGRDSAGPGDPPPRAASLASPTRWPAAFNGPHDIEWVIADDGRVQLMRVRPVVRLHVDARRARGRPGAAPGARRRRRLTRPGTANTPTTVGRPGHTGPADGSRGMRWS